VTSVLRRRISMAALAASSYRVAALAASLAAFHLLNLPRGRAEISPSLAKASLGEQRGEGR